MTDTRITALGTTYDRDDLALATDYLIGDRSGGSSFRILAEEVVHGVLENTADPIIVGSDLNVDGGTLFVDVSTNRVGVGTGGNVDTLLHLQDHSNAPEIRLESGASAQNVTLGAESTGATGAAFYVKVKTDGGATTERVRVTSSGNVGIGVTSPSAKLQVNGGIAIVDGMTAPSAISGYAQFYVDASGGDLKIIFGDGTVKTIMTDT